MAGLYVVGWSVDRLAMWAMNHADPRWLSLNWDDAILAANAVVSVALFLYSRKSSRDPGFILDLGLVYLVLTALGLGLLIHWHGAPADTPANPMISWVGVVILIFAAIVPSTPVKTLVAGLVAASMNPLAMVFVRAMGRWDFGPTSRAFLMHYPDFLLAGVAVVIARVVTGLGRQVASAREMGSYQLGELIGRGGMGEVYKATHRMFARPAAIKLIRGDVIAAGDGEAARLAVKRFRREAEAAANLRSPHTVALYDFGVTEDRTLYFVMELLEGMDLQTLVEHHGPVSASRAIHIIRQVCDSLEEAHACGLVHRDIKPANIHVGRVGLQYDFVKVLDFGLVKSVAGENIEQSQATVEGLAPGSPAYMSPEALVGETLDARADVYGVGCVAYYLITGKLVFEADTVVKIIAKHLRSEPIPPSERGPLHVPPALDRLVLACLAKRPQDRPAGAGRLARALAAIDAGPWDEAQAREWWRVNVEARH
jgi:serine/threonine-protein kinase